MILKRMPVSSDLSRSSYEYASSGIIKPVLYISVSLLTIAENLRVLYAIDTDLPKDSWYVKGENGGWFSVGV